MTVGPLAGYTIGVTAARRSAEFGSALERRGAQVAYAPAIRLEPLADDTATLHATRECIDCPPDILVVTTGIGLRGWLDAADGCGVGQPLIDTLARSTIVARGPKARGAIRAAGLTEAWSPPSESSAEVLAHLVETGVAGKRIAVQLHGQPVPELVDGLRTAGADVLEIPVYRWLPPSDVAPLHRLLNAIGARQVTAVAFTSAPAAATFVQEADNRVLQALRDDVLACCIGPVTAAPLQQAGVPVIAPDRPRLGALVREIAAQVPTRCGRRVRAAGHRLDVRGHLVVVDGAAIPLPTSAMTLLRALAREPGHVVGRRELHAACGIDSRDAHALDVAIARLRAALGDSRIIRTVVKRGYRLETDLP